MMLCERQFGAGRAPREPYFAPASVQRGGVEGAKSRFYRSCFESVFTISMHLALGLIDSELGGAWSCVDLKLRTSILSAFYKHF